MIAMTTCQVKKKKKKLATDFFYETDIKLRHTPLFIKIHFLPCPPGFFLSGDPPGCQCHPILTTNGVNCILNYLNWLPQVEFNQHLDSSGGR
jgi:hypothetical protein